MFPCPARLNAALQRTTYVSMTELRKLWAGRVYGTNTGNIFVEFDEVEPNVAAHTNADFVQDLHLKWLAQIGSLVRTPTFLKGL